MTDRTTTIIRHDGAKDKSQGSLMRNGTSTRDEVRRRQERPVIEDVDAGRVL
jgi:hypothetical protein